MAQAAEIERLTKLVAEKDAELAMSKRSVKSYKRAVGLLVEGGNHKKTKTVLSSGAAGGVTQQIKRLSKEGNNCIACLFRREKSSMSSHGLSLPRRHRKIPNSHCPSAAPCNTALQGCTRERGKVQ